MPAICVGLGSSGSNRGADSSLIVDTLGMPTQACLICADNPDSTSSHSSAVSENPAIADWLFYERISKFVKAFYVGILGATDYWFIFEWQHRGSPHVHGLAWLPDEPNVERLLSYDDISCLLDAMEQITSYIDSLVSTMNPGIPADGNNLQNATPLPKTNPHVCNRSYAEIKDLNMDLVDLIATCRWHIRCSMAYCLKHKKANKSAGLATSSPCSR